MGDQILYGLNASQSAAVSSAAQTLAILAGPGSGKTHTLTSRTAWLLKHEGYQPWDIIVATFTVKAAREMKERIGRLIGDGMESKLILGTFHSIAFRYLTRYGHLIGISKGFGIADGNNSLSIIKRIVKRHGMTIDAASARSRISSRKAKGSDRKETKPGQKTTVDTQELETCFIEYEDNLKTSNLLDYDDLLLRCVELLRSHPSCVSNVEAVLIDEFQDTNLVQFDLMRLFAAQRKRITIVGDPDQSIYGFRSAETKNFRRMTRQYPDTVIIPLEENYRSSGSILLAALEVIRQDSSRMDKSLLATHTVGTQPVMRKLASAHIEAQWIVGEIKRVLTLTGDLMTFDDVAILLRSAALSRTIESALGKAGVPYQMIGGRKFYDRAEVKLVLDYLKVFSQPDNNDALASIINVPSRRIGETTVKALLDEAEKSKSTFWGLILNVAQGNITPRTKLARQAEQGISSLVNIILTARDKMVEDSEMQSPVSLIEFIVKKVNLEEHLEKVYPEDHESRFANIQELIGMAVDFASQCTGDDDDALPEVEGLHQEDLSQPLSRFLSNIALASEVKATEEGATVKAQVTISTIHAAKGLEWPIVFIPATYQGSIPHSRAEDDDEERRLLYVAMTRAKAMLYLSCPLKNTQREQTALSPFLTPKTLKPFFSNKGPIITSPMTGTMAQILRRPIPATFDHEAIANLEYVEDDEFPVDGEEIELPARHWDKWQGHHYTQGQQPLKRRRVNDNGPSTAASADTWKTAYATTVNQASSFTVSTIPKPGFTSAASHHQTLREQSLSHLTQNKVAELSESTKLDDEVKLPNSRPGLTRSTKAVAAQGSIASFFTRPTGGASVSVADNKRRDALAPAKQNVSLAAPAKPAGTSHGKPFLSNAAAGAGADYSGILPSLANHRVGAASLPLPTKRWKAEEESGTFKRPYVFLSSSPQAPEHLIREAEESLQFVEPLNLECRVGAKQQDIVPKPFPMFHVTTVAKLNTLKGPPPRRTLGMARATTTWADRMKKGG